MAINTDYINSLKEQTSNCKTCEELQEISNSVHKIINEQIAAMNKQIAALTPLLALLASPAASPGDIVSWITGLIDSLIKPMTLPITEYTAQIAELTTALSELQALIDNASLKFPECLISPPV